MIKAIVYNSNAGHTKKYAEMLSESISLPIFTVEDAKDLLPKDSEIIFLSWVKNSCLTKYKSISKLYNVKMIGAVGINDYDDEEIREKFIGYNNIKTDRVFFLKGGVNLSKLTIKGRSFFSIAGRKLKSYIIKSGNASIDEYEKVDMLENGGSFVYKTNLDDLICDYQKI